MKLGYTIPAIFPFKKTTLLVSRIGNSAFAVDTLQYFLNEVTKKPYIDGECDIAFQLHRYWKQDSTEHYQVKDVWSIKKTVISLEKVE